MFSPDELDARRGVSVSRPARALTSALERTDRLFDRVFSSSFNPLYRTGTVAVLLLGIALVTGVYLLFAYEIGRPYESVLGIQRDVLVGRWVRALHRYASDAAVVAVAVHVLRLVVQRKTWGPRALAWITGVLLTGMMFLSAATGFVLVWDRFGQALAIAGARMLRLLPLFPEPPDRAFVGAAPMPSQFFFMNLFLHVAVPLGMVCFLWLHTSRLARASWFPERRLTLAIVLGFVALAVAWPAPLPPPADLLALPGRVPADLFYGFWLPVAERSPLAALGTMLVVTAVLVGVPWWLRPRRAAVPAPAFSDPDHCEGCEQCRNDCPYDAIEMVTGKHPDVHPLRALVQPDLCTSCGICAASCASLAIGPPGRTARDQLAAARRLVAATGDAEHRTLVVACTTNVALAMRVERTVTDDRGLAAFTVECAGTLHPGTVSYLGRHFGGTLIVACPPRNCIHRLGASLADARILGDRKPAVAGRIARLRVQLVHASVSEWGRVVSGLDALRTQPGAAASPQPRMSLRGRAIAAVSSAALLGLVAIGARWPLGTDADHAVLRLGWRLAGQARERCRELTAEELAARPVHMRQARECVSEALAYDLTAAVDGRVIVRKRVHPAGLRGDRPLSVEEDLPVQPGARAITIRFVPEDPASGGRVLAFDGALEFERGRVVLVTNDGDRLAARSRTN
ncbi:MAG TPA: 4Fe-4S binding protein [Vicinamibacterales bacterium]|nr:4Fe-4S binding protein [Vicinamibacterales bacterium]